MPPIVEPRIPNLFCIQCGRPLTPGRPDRKFCCSLCKSRWHNAQIGRFHNYRLRVINALDRNHRILLNLSDNGIRSVSRIEALSLGFQPDYFTSCNQVRSHVEYVCYDVRYYLSRTRIWGILRVEPFGLVYPETGTDIKNRPPRRVDDYV